MSLITAQEQAQRRRGAPQLRYDSSALDEAIGTTQAYLLKQQATDGYWVGELESDVTVSAGYIPLMRFLHISQPERERKIVSLLKGEQRPDGGWSSYRGGPSDLNVSVQAYFALKLAGVSPEEPSLRRAREFVLSQGGVTRTHTFTKLLLAQLGQYDWRGLPSLPPEVIFLPNWFYVNIYEFASWARETIVDLMVLLTTKPVGLVPESQGVWELYDVPREEIDWSLPRPQRPVSWQGFFLFADRLFKLYERLPWQPGRRRALQRVEEWIVEHQEADGSWGGIMLPWVYSLIALKSLGYPNDHPVMAKAIEGLEGFIVEDERTFHLQPAVSPVWDTALSVIALRDSGLERKHPALVRAAEWLLDEQVLTGGDWQVKNPDTEPGGWAFEFVNDLYPDVDDSAVVAVALRRVETTHEEAKREAIERARRWVVSMQSKSGGWAAFDKDNDKELLAHIPYADFLTPLDPTSVDVTAHAVELLAGLGHEANDGSLERALDYLWSEQEEDGSWYGRWGVNYVYGIGAVLPALKQAKVDMSQPHVRRAVEWLKAHQNEDGGWGESCGTYDDPSVRGQGESTPSQTAWALMALLAASEGDSPAARRGVDYLLSTQKVDGTWDEEQYTGTGFPRAFYLRYHMYRVYFPLLALGRYRNWLQGST